MRMLEVRTEAFRPLWRRVAVTAVCIGWASVEAISGAWVWAAIFGAAGAWLVWAFFFTFEDGPAGQEKDE